MPTTVPASPEPFYSNPRRTWLFLIAVFFAVHFAALFAPPLEDDVDATHAQVAQHMLLSGNYVTAYVNGIRYLEKPPMPYWVIALDYQLFGFNVFATHLPLTLSVLALAILVWIWARRAFGDLAAFYSALAILTSLGIFLYTRFLIPEALLTFLFALALYATLTSLEDHQPHRMYIAWAAIALAMLTKGLVAPVFYIAAIVPWLLLTGDWRRWRELRPFSGLLLFLAIAAPWHVLAALQNPDHGHPIGNVPSAGGVHGFLYFYFINEQVLRFLGRRFPMDYNKQATWIYWLGHIAWLFPWSLYLPLVFQRLWRSRATWFSGLKQHSTLPELAREEFRKRTVWLLTLFSAFILLFFSVSTNQEYYTFPAWFALLMLIASVVASYEQRATLTDPALRRRGVFSTRGESLIGIHLLLAAICVAAAVTLGYCLWTSRHLPFEPDVGAALAHRNVADYSLSMSHLFDLTGRAFAGLRLPSILAALALLFGPAAALRFRRQHHHLRATVTIALTSAAFLIAAHIALVRFGGMLGSKPFADTINRVSGYAGRNPALEHDAQLIIYGDQSNASSVVFYTRRQALLVNGRSSSMIWGSWYPDAPHIFLDDADLLRLWSTSPRHWLVVDSDDLKHVTQLLGTRAICAETLADKTLFTDQPLPRSR